MRGAGVERLHFEHLVLRRAGEQRLRILGIPLLATIATETASPGLLRKAMPRPRASSSGKTKTQKTTSGSRFSSSMRAMRRWEYPDHRPLRRGGVGFCFSIFVGVSWATVIHFDSRSLCRP